ncbi:signal transduction histidine kinase [Prauserella rugosa]|uniref:histidine kinase n=2 Tax=Prauserella rugosa TaxID=43354 RepID=A0A660CAU2_9PSEU|nr:signal transduction histidine kinase [Prauserella rugosa]
MVTMVAVLGGMVLLIVLVNSMGLLAFGTAPSIAEQLAWGTALCLPLVARRRFPVAVLVVVGALFIAAQARQIGDNTVPSLCVFLACYSVGAWEQNRRAARWSRVGVIIAMFVWLLVSTLEAAGQPSGYLRPAGPLDPVMAAVLHSFVINIAFFGSAYFFGNMAWETARRRHELEERNAQLRCSQQENLRGAVVAERVRIARDLHDVVAHSVSVMGIQAGAARRVLDRDPVLAGEALQTVEETARTAIGELRGLLGVLRSDAEIDTRASDEIGDHAASPGLDDLPELVSRMDSSGIVAHYGVYGEPRPVPDALALTVYRVVQEALTNVVKHSGAQTVDVRVRFLATALEVEIVDDGYGRGGSGGSGLGQVGIRERVAVHGGHVEFGRRDEGRGYRVRASLPLGLRAVTRPQEPVDVAAGAESEEVR